MEICIDCGKEILGKKKKEMCERCYSRKRYKKNPEKANDRSKKWQKENPEKVRVAGRKRYKENPEKFKECSKKWKKENPEKFKECSKKWRKENKDKIKIRDKKYHGENKDKIKEYRNRPNVNIAIRLRKRLRSALKLYTEEGKIMSSKKYGLDIKAIAEHIGHCPGDRSLYHIDHIRPLCSFNFINKDGTQNLEQIRLANRPENHQWLLSEENLSKNGKWGTEEQVRYLFI